MTKSIVIVEKFKKGTNARVLGNYANETLAKKIISEKNWVGKRGSPHIVDTSKVNSFIASKVSGMYSPNYSKIPIELAKKRHESLKRQQAYDKKRGFNQSKRISESDYKEGSRQQVVKTLLAKQAHLKSQKEIMSKLKHKTAKDWEKAGFKVDKSKTANEKVAFMDHLFKKQGYQRIEDSNDYYKISKDKRVKFINVNSPTPVRADIPESAKFNEASLNKIGGKDDRRTVLRDRGDIGFIPNFLGSEKYNKKDYNKLPRYKSYEAIGKSNKNTDFLKRINPQYWYDVGTSKYEDKLHKHGESLLYKHNVGEKDFKSIIYPTAYIAYNYGKGFGDVFMHPVETTKGLYSMVRHPIHTRKEIVTELSIDPFGTSARLIGGYKALKTTGKGVDKLSGGKVSKRISKIKEKAPKTTSAIEWYVAPEVKGLSYLPNVFVFSSANKLRIKTGVDIGKVNSILNKKSRVNREIQKTISKVSNEPTQEVLKGQGEIWLNRRKLWLEQLYENGKVPPYNVQKAYNLIKEVKQFNLQFKKPKTKSLTINQVKRIMNSNNKLQKLKYQNYIKQVIKEREFLNDNPLIKRRNIERSKERKALRKHYVKLHGKGQKLTVNEMKTIFNKLKDENINRQLTSLRSYQELLKRETIGKYYRNDVGGVLKDKKLRKRLRKVYKDIGESEKPYTTFDELIRLRNKKVKSVKHDKSKVYRQQALESYLGTVKRDVTHSRNKGLRRTLRKIYRESGESGRPYNTFNDLVNLRKGRGKSLKINSNKVYRQQALETYLGLVKRDLTKNKRLRKQFLKIVSMEKHHPLYHHFKSLEKSREIKPINIYKLQAKEHFSGMNKYNLKDKKRLRKELRKLWLKEGLFQKRKIGNKEEILDITKVNPLPKHRVKSSLELIKERRRKQVAQLEKALDNYNKQSRKVKYRKQDKRLRRFIKPQQKIQETSQGQKLILLPPKLKYRFKTKSKQFQDIKESFKQPTRLKYSLGDNVRFRPIILVHRDKQNVLSKVHVSQRDKVRSKSAIKQDIKIKQRVDPRSKFKQLYRTQQKGKFRQGIYDYVSKSRSKNKEIIRPITRGRVTKTGFVFDNDDNLNRKFKGISAVSRTYDKKGHFIDKEEGVGKTLSDAISLGQRRVDDNKATSFSIIPSNREGITYPNARVGYKFVKRHGRWFEKNKYRNDRNAEKRFSMMRRPKAHSY